MIALGLTLFLQLQMGVTVQPDTVTVGQRFVAKVRVRAPLGSVITFPASPDSSASVALAGPARRRELNDPGSTDATTTYVLAAWDVGPQSLGLAPVTVRTPSGSLTAPVAGTGVFVRSVLPADSALRKPKPARAVLAVSSIRWWPWIVAAAALVAGALAWRGWVIYSRRRRKPLPPADWAEREFRRIESLRLVESGDPERHGVLMADVLRGYLARRLPGVTLSATTRELAAALVAAGVAPVERVARLLARTDLVKFARASLTGEEARAVGAEARSLAREIELAAQAAERAAARSAESSPAPPAPPARAAA